MTRQLAVLATSIVFSTVVALAAQTATTPQTATKPAAPAKKVVLPPAVESAFKAAYPTATITQVSKEKEGGQDTYEVESVDKGVRRDVEYKPDGTLIDVEEEIAASDLPQAVASAITARYPKATLVKREKVTKGSTVTYEVQLKNGPKEVELTPDGKWVSPKLSK